jgi:hypothetical protein
LWSSHVKNPLAGIFMPKDPDPPKPEPRGGLDVLRARSRGHARLPQGANWLRESLHVNEGALDAFLAGGPLPLPKIKLLIDYLGMRCEYLPDVDLLRSTAPEPSSAGVPPEPYVAKPFTPSTAPIGLGCYAPPLYPRADGAEQPAPRPAGWAP